MDPKIEERETNDYLGKNPMEALALGLAAFADRAPHDRVDLAAAIARVAPDVVIVDPNSWGALATAEASGLPWCVFQPYFSPLPSRDAPPFGPGLAPARSRLGRLRDRMLLPLTFGKLDKLALAPVNEMRTAAGLDPAQSMVEVLTRPPLTLYFTAEPLEYHRSDWPDTYEMVGPASWNPPAETPDWLAEVDRPIVLVTCSTEKQDDRTLLQAVLDGLAGSEFFVVGTSGAHDPESFDIPPNARVERFVAHDPIVTRSAVVVCHGGMGITQRALLHAVPPVIVPFGRDQHEVARRVEHAGAGVSLSPKKLTPERLRQAVEDAQARAGGARRIAAAFGEAGGDTRAADLVENLLDSGHGREGTVSSSSAS